MNSKKIILGILTALIILFITIIYVKWSFWNEIENDKYLIGSLQFYISDYNDLNNENPDKTKIKDFLNRNNKNLKLTNNDIHVTEMDGLLLINIRTDTSILNSWNEDKGKVSEVNYNNIESSNSFIKFLINDQSTYTLYLN
ncbi:hypothetical protein F0365_12510 [Nonlabens sp. Ci31]|jgi:cell division protein FtsL|uniref:hypothetical protein n=1 Tax=Nonlabens sp. Ci31 TaxID=2608253 RepID=UPI0014634DD0|nr:hypothetical protein [Nonlabens sp. Ci31]QJP35151.1 hypothetical protein F0365_12510 [Nonlabens sp. Ci31]